MNTVYRGFTTEQLQAQYSARAAVPEHPEIFRRWQEQSAAFRREAECLLDLEYGKGDRERIDLFPTDSAPSPVMLFIHGGYWQAMDKGAFSFLARELVNRGVAVAIMNYGLCPAVTLDQIVDQSRRALVWLWSNAEHYGVDPDRIHLCGHSAGGHLLGMLMATDWRDFDPAPPPDVIKSALSISGLFELEPLIHTAINDALRLDRETAIRNSPLLLRPEARAPFVLTVGGEESEEFHRQSREMSLRWASEGVATSLLELPSLNHFTMLDQLALPGTLLTRHALALVKGGEPPD